MSRLPLDPATALDVRLSAICSRNRYATDPEAVLAKLRETAGDRGDILASVAGLWAGFHESDPHRQVLVAALRTIPGAEEHVPEGRFRRGAGSHSTGPMHWPRRPPNAMADRPNAESPPPHPRG